MAGKDNIFEGIPVDTSQALYLVLVKMGVNPSNVPSQELAELARKQIEFERYLMELVERYGEK